jgi:hypothetical protein
MSIMEIVQCQSNLLQIVQTLRPAGRSASLLNGRQQYRNQHRYNRNDHQQFDQSKPGPVRNAANTAPGPLSFLHACHPLQVQPPINVGILRVFCEIKHFSDPFTLRIR